MNTKAYPGTQAVRRAVALLKAFDDERPVWGLSELARETGLNKATAYRLLSALEREGMLDRAADGESYTLGPEVVVMGGRALRGNNLRAIARRELEQLAEETRETASLEILSGNEMLVIDEIAGGYLMGGVPNLGSRWPLHASSTGLAVLAYLPEPEAAGLLPRSLPRITPATVTGRDALRAELICTRERGYSVADETLEVGLVAIAGPIFNHDGLVVAAISIAGPKLRVSAELIPHIGERIRKAAGLVSSRLGYRS